MSTEFPMLNQSDVKRITKLNRELSDTWTKRQIFRTETEMRVSVLNDGKHPTPASKYWQSVREQGVMFENLTTLSFEYRRNEIALMKAEKNIQELDDEFDRMESEIDRDECLFRRSNIEQVARDRVREIEQWSVIKKELDDGSFDTQNVNTHQMESLHLTLKNRAKSLTSGSSDAEVMNALGPLKTMERIKSNGTHPD